MEKTEALKSRFDTFLHQCDFSGKPTELYAPIDYTVRQKGKRLRPMLCLLGCDLFGGSIDNALWPALALEVFHNFTLIHDDIMDQAPLRRGMETVYQKWSPNVAILSGDAMLAMAFLLVMRTPNAVAAANLLGKVAREVCEGQQLDLNFETSSQVTIDAYLEMIRLKTAVLLATSLQMGALVANADTVNIMALYKFGIAAGMAFQLQDDLLDCYGDVQVFGKVTGGDIAENKKTYLFLKALELASDEDKERLEYLFTGHLKMDLSEKITEVKRIYDKLQVKEAVENRMEDYYHEAEACLDAVRVPEERKVALKHYVAQLSGRVR